MRRASILVLAVVVAGGCGGGGGKPLTKQEFAAKADAICSKYNEQTKQLSNPSSMDELAKVADKTLTILDDALGDLRKLKPPANEQATVNEWLASVGNLRSDLKDIRDKARASDQKGIQDVLPKATEHNAKSNQLATKLGMKVCNTD